MTRQCPRCGGAGTVYEPRLCTCGHTRADHIPGAGCVGYGGYCLDDCRRFKPDPDQDDHDRRALQRDAEYARADASTTRGAAS